MFSITRCVIPRPCPCAEQRQQADRVQREKPVIRSPLPCRQRHRDRNRPGLNRTARGERRKAGSRTTITVARRWIDHLVDDPSMKHTIGRSDHAARPLGHGGAQIVDSSRRLGSRQRVADGLRVIFKAHRKIGHSLRGGHIAVLLANHLHQGPPSDNACRRIDRPLIDGNPQVTSGQLPTRAPRLAHPFFHRPPAGVSIAQDASASVRPCLRPAPGLARTAYQAVTRNSFARIYRGCLPRRNAVDGRTVGSIGPLPSAIAVSFVKTSRPLR